jgi:hypothetical protein
MYTVILQQNYAGDKQKSYNIMRMSMSGIGQGELGGGQAYDHSSD